jgi:hypothetical protein
VLLRGVMPMDEWMGWSPWIRATPTEEGYEGSRRILHGGAAP